jgi:Cation transporting ATPase, C-terminus
MYRNIVGVALYQLVVCLVLQYAGKPIFNIDDCVDFSDGRGKDGDCGQSTLDINSIIFNVFVFMQIGSEINSRRIPELNVFAGILKSYMFMVIIAITVVIQVALMFGVGGTSVGDSIGIGRIGWKGWVASVVLGAAVLPWGSLVRLWPLDWMIGPTDEEPLEMSKLEKLLRFPARKPPIFDRPSDDELGIVDGTVPRVAKDVDKPIVAFANDTDMTVGKHPIMQRLASQELAAARPKAALPAKVRLRIFVHAVAFINVVSRSDSRLGRRSEDVVEIGELKNPSDAGKP